MEEQKIEAPVIETMESATEHVLALTESVEQLERNLKNYEDQVVINKEKQAIIEAGYRPLKCTMEYEENERFWVIMLEELKFKHRMVNNTDDNKLEEMKSVIVERTELLDEARATLTRLSEEEA